MSLHSSDKKESFLGEKTGDVENGNVDVVSDPEEGDIVEFDEKKDLKYVFLRTIPRALTYSPLQAWSQTETYSDDCPRWDNRHCKYLYI